MKTTNLLSAPQSVKSNLRNQVSSRQVQQEATAQENFGLEATDVTFVSHRAKAEAVRKGTGVMIGDYFVGVTTGIDLLFSHPAIVY
jgi:hypothetical protein